MTNLLIFFIVILTSFAYIFTKRKLFITITIVVLGVFCYLNTNLPDNANYKTFYDSVGKGDNSEFLGVGWLYLSKIGNYIGLSYEAFKSIVYVFALSLLAISINLISKQSQPAFLFYLIFPGLLDVIQIRFFLASSLMIFGFVLLVRTKGILGIISYLLFLIPAILIHNSTLFFILFTFIPLISKFKFRFKNLVILIIIADILVIVLSKYLVSLLYFVLPEIQVSRIEAYVNGDTTSLLGMILYSAFMMGELALVYYLSKTKASYSKNNRKSIRYVLYANALLLLSLPFVYLSSDFMRLQRAFLVMNYAITYALIPRNYTVSKNIFGFQLSLKTVSYMGLIAYFVVFILIFNNSVFFGLFSI